jgi:hypothetical protein
VKVKEKVEGPVRVRIGAEPEQVAPAPDEANLIGPVGYDTLK